MSLCKSVMWSSCPEGNERMFDMRRKHNLFTVSLVVLQSAVFISVICLCAGMPEAQDNPNSAVDQTVKDIESDVSKLKENTGRFCAALSAANPPSAQKTSYTSKAATAIKTHLAKYEEEIKASIEKVKKECPDMAKELKSIRKEFNEIREDARKSAKMCVEGQISKDESERKFSNALTLWNKGNVYLQKAPEITRKLSGIKIIIECLRQIGAESEAKYAGAKYGDLQAQVDKLSLRGTFGPKGDEKMYKDNRKIDELNQKVKTTTTMLERQCVDMVNNYREMFGIKILKIDERLVQSARKHSGWMVKTGMIIHDENVPGRETVTQRLNLEGYNAYGGENVGGGSDDPQILFDAWCTSPGHHMNMLDTDWLSIGIGNDSGYWTQNFGME